ncbi:MAG: hypothetical protein H0X30_21825, partial [Anaerolineae bacterium]|nr:hypothetical protein [Anaerolineae bacterium]
FSSYFDDTFVGVYLPLKNQTFSSESDWLNTLALSTMQILSQKDFSLYKLPKQDAEDQDMRRWMMTEYLPEMFAIIRGRRLVWLLDDTGSLIQWIKAGKLPADHFAYLDGLVKQFQNLGIIMAMDSRYEMLIPTMSPLVSVTDVYRLANLTEDETRALIQQPIQNQYRISDDASAAVFAATAGQPRLVQRFGAALYDYMQVTDTPRTILAIEDVKTVSNTVQQQSNTDFRKIWDETGRNERLLLTAITRLMVDDPLTAVNVTAISDWLIESDYPLDLTTINAAVRGLEYDELIENNKGNISFKSSLMQVWLLQNAELQTASTTTVAPPRRGLIAAAIVLALIILVLVFVVSQQPPANQPSSSTAQPTLTLIANP